MLRNNHVCLTHTIAIGVVHILTMQQNHHIRILLNRTGLTQIRDHRALIGALLRTTVQLRERNDRNFKFLRQKFETTGKLRDLLLTRLNFLFLWRETHPHETFRPIADGDEFMVTGV